MVHALIEGLLKHVQKLVHKCQLEDFLVDNSKDDFELLVNLPLQKVVLISELLARASLSVLQ